jgi:hypothetical protein
VKQTAEQETENAEDHDHNDRSACSFDFDIGQEARETQDDGCQRCKMEKSVHPVSQAQSLLNPTSAVVKRNRLF